MGLGKSLSDLVSERLVEVVRRVGERDYSRIDLGGVSPESDPELAARELAWHLFPVGEAAGFKMKRVGDDVVDGIALIAEVFAQHASDEQWRFDNYGLVFGLGDFGSRREGEKSSRWKTEIEGKIKFLQGDFDSLTVTAHYADGEVDRTDYMGFAEHIGKRFTQLCIPWGSGDRHATAISLEGYVGQFTKPQVNRYAIRKLARLTASRSIPLGLTTSFRRGNVRSVAYFQTERPEDSGIFCVRSTASKGVFNDSYGNLPVPSGNVAHLVLTELTDDNLKMTREFLRNYCFVPNE